MSMGIRTSEQAAPQGKHLAARPFSTDQPIVSPLVRIVLTALAALTGVAGINIFFVDSLLPACPFAGFVFVLEALVFGAFLWFLFSPGLMGTVYEGLDKLARRVRFDSWSAPLRIALLMLLGLVILAIYFPGIEAGDTHSQLIDYFDGVSTFAYHEGGETEITALFNDHHPFLTTLVYGWFAQLGRLLGNERFGFALLCLALLSLYAFTYSSVLDLFRDSPLAVRFGTFVFYACNLFLAYYEVTVVKDSIYSPLFLLYFIDFIRIYRDDCKASTLPRFVALSVLLPFTKKTAIYLELIANAFLLLYRWRKGSSKQLLLSSGLAILLPFALSMVIMPRVVYPAFNIYPGGKQEVLASLFHQTARLKMEHPEAFSKEDAAAVEALIDFEHIDELYHPTWYDHVKNSYKLGTATNEDIARYLKVWLKGGLQHPFTYIRALFGLSNGYFAPTTYLEVYYGNYTYPFSERGPLPDLREAAGTFYIWLLSLPGLSLLETLVFYTWWIPLVSFGMIVRRERWGTCVLFSPIVLSILILVICPYSWSRYALPLIVAAPLLLFMPSLFEDES